MTKAVRINTYTEFNSKGIKEKLTKMLEKGYILKAVTDILWIYEKTDTKNLKVDITYTENIENHDLVDEISIADKEFIEFCEESGFIYATNFRSMLIFYSDLDMLPLETDKQLKFENIHNVLSKRLKQKMIICLMLILFYLFQAINAPASTLAKTFSSMHFMILLIISCIVIVALLNMLIKYISWYLKYKNNDYDTEDMEVNFALSGKLKVIVFTIWIIISAISIYNGYISTEGLANIILLLSIFITTFLLFAIVGLILKLYVKDNQKRKIIFIVVGVAGVLLVNFSILSFLPDADYQKNKDKMPILLEDFYDTTEEVQGMYIYLSSILAEYYEIIQIDNDIMIDVTISKVKFTPLTNLVIEDTFNYYEDRYYLYDVGFEKVNQPMWNTDLVYTKTSRGMTYYVIIYDNIIAEICVDGIEIADEIAQKISEQILSIK